MKGLNKLSQQHQQPVEKTKAPGMDYLKSHPCEPEKPNIKFPVTIQLLQNSNLQNNLERGISPCSLTNSKPDTKPDVQTSINQYKCKINKMNMNDFNKNNNMNSMPVENGNFALAEQVVKEIEASNPEIKTDYSTWQNIWHALANELGEDGRGFYHQIGSLFKNYSFIDYENQYNVYP